MQTREASVLSHEDSDSILTAKALLVFFADSVTLRRSVVRWLLFAQNKSRLRGSKRSP